ncbi:MAG: DUF192 domain-containing protein [Deltaproteobacteria bacterium]|nr:DUF192 domain-containing protein [Deltaproteobacteria bacterium]
MNRTRSTILAARASRVDKVWGRMRGLLGAPPLAPGEGMILDPCRSVHTFFLGYSIDVVFVARDGRVVGIVPGLRPWRLSGWFGDARAAVELPSGTTATTGTVAGDLLGLEPLDGSCSSS